MQVSGEVVSSFERITVKCCMRLGPRVSVRFRGEVPSNGRCRLSSGDSMIADMWNNSSAVGGCFTVSINFAFPICSCY